MKIEKKTQAPPIKEAPEWQWESGVFLVLMLLGGCCMSDQLVDWVLLPRFQAVNILLLASFVLIAFRHKYLSISWDIVSLSSLIYVLLAYASISWAIVKSEAIFHSCRILVGLLLFFLSATLLKKNPVIFMQIAQVVVGLVFLYSFVALGQMARIEKVDEHFLYDIYGLGAHKNLFSCFLFLSIPFLGYGVVFSKRYLRPFFLIGLLPCLFFIVILQTRAVWVGSVVAFSAFMGLFVWKNKAKVFGSARNLAGLAAIVVIGALLIGFALVKFQFLDLFSEKLNVLEYGKSQSVQERYQQWNSTLKIAKEHPISGVGAGNWPFYFPKFTLVGNQEALDGFTFQRPHNDFLWVLSELGILGLIAYLSIYLVPIFYALQRCRKGPMDSDNLVLWLATSVLLGLLCISFFDFPRERIELLLLSYVLLGFLYSKIQLPALKVLKTKWIYLSMIILPLLLFSIMVGFSRWKGEKAAIKLYTAKEGKDWEALKRIAKATASFLYEVEPASMPIAWYQGLAQCQLGDYQGGLSTLKEAHRLAPYNYLVLNNMGICYSQLDDPFQAKSLFFEALRINPSYDEARLNLALVYYSEKDYKKAYEYVSQAKPSARKERYEKAILPLLSK